MWKNIYKPTKKLISLSLFVFICSSLSALHAIHTSSPLHDNQHPDANREGKELDQIQSIGVVIGGTNIRLGMVSGSGQLSQHIEEIRWRKKFGEGASSTRLISEIMKKIENLLDKTENIKRVKKIGISFAGPVDCQQGLAGTPFPAPNLPFDNYPLAQVIEKNYLNLCLAKYPEHKLKNIKVSVYNDSHAAALGEFNYDTRPTKYGMVFILGTGTNAAVYNDGEIYTDKGALLELGFNLLKSNSRGDTWIFTGKEMRGRKPLKGSGDNYNIDLFSGEGIAKQFIQSDQAEKIVAQFVDVPHDMLTIKRLFEIMSMEPGKTEKERTVVISALLKGITKAVSSGNPPAIKFVKKIGRELGMSLAALVQNYHQEPWVEEIVLVGGIGENFALTNKNPSEGDFFITAIQTGLRDGLLKFREANKLTQLTTERIHSISKGVRRSKIDWKREILAAMLTIADRSGIEYAEGGL